MLFLLYRHCKIAHMTLRIRIGSSESGIYVDLPEGAELPFNLDDVNNTPLRPWQKLKGAKLVSGERGKGGKIVYRYRDSSLDRLEMSSNIKSSSVEETTETPIINGQPKQIDRNLLATGTD